jgi:hypothetical protein
MLLKQKRFYGTTRCYNMFTEDKCHIVLHLHIIENKCFLLSHYILSITKFDTFVIIMFYVLNYEENVLTDTLYSTA